MHFSILGPLEVHDPRGRALPVGGSRLRRLLVVLLLDPGRTVTAERLIDAIWEAEPPAAADNALQALVSRLRRTLGRDAPVRVEPTGYRLSASSEQVDLFRFQGCVERGHTALAAQAHERAVAEFDAALALWRGSPLADLADSSAAEGMVIRLAEERLRAVEARIEAYLGLGDHSGVIEVATDAEVLVAQYPLRERPVGLLMRALAALGRQAESLNVYHAYSRRVAEEFGADPSAELRRLHVEVLRGEGVDAAGETPAADVGSRLPHQLTSFVGRGGEVRDSIGELERERLLTFTGPGGAGKTRLSIEVASALAAKRPDLVADGVWFAELAEVTDGRDVAHTILNVLGLRESSLVRLPAAAVPAPSEPLERLVDALRDQRLLLIVDNCEHLVQDTARLIGRILAACARVRVVTTSREPLGIAGERLRGVPSLRLPPENASAQQAAEYPSVRLFVDRVRAVTRGFVLDEGSAGHVVRICRELDGMPLALELAAARARTLPIAQLAAGLHDRFRLLTTGNRLALPRHRTLLAVVDWSWELLDESERALLRRFSVFSGGSALESIEEVCADAGVDVWPTVFALVDKSLLVTDDSGPAPRYRMLETVRAYSARELLEAGEDMAVREAHAECMLGLWTRADPYLRTAAQLEWMRVLRVEHDNLAAALRWACDSGRPELALRLCGSALWYWQTCDCHSEASRIIGDVLALFSGEPPAELALTYAECLVVAACAEHMAAAEPQVAEERLVRAAEIAEAAGNAVVSHPHLLFARPFLAVVRSDIPDGLEYLSQWAGTGDRWTRAGVLSIIGMLSSMRGEIGRARQALRRALADFRALGERWGAMQALIGLGDIAQSSDLAEEAALLKEGRTLAAEVGLPEAIHAFDVRLAHNAARAKEFAAAHGHIEDARQGAAPRSSQAIVDIAAADIERRAGAPARAREALARVRPQLDSGGAAMRAAVRSLWHLAMARVEQAEHNVGAMGAQMGFGWRESHAANDAQLSAGMLDGLAGAELAADRSGRAAALLCYAELLRGAADICDPDVAATRAEALARLGEAGFAQAREQARRTPRAEIASLVSGWVA